MSDTLPDRPAVVEDAPGQRLAERLTALRHRDPGAVVRLAAQLGVSPGTVESWRHQRARPRLGTLPRLAELVDIDLADVLADLGVPRDEAMRRRVATDPATSLPWVLRAWRDAAGLAIADVPAALGISRFWWARLEAGSVVPGMRGVVQLLEATMLPAEAIVEGLPAETADRLRVWAYCADAEVPTHLRELRADAATGLEDAAAGARLVVARRLHRAEIGEIDLTDEELVRLARTYRGSVAEVLRLTGWEPERARRVAHAASQVRRSHTELAGPELLRDARHALSEAHRRGHGGPDREGAPTTWVAEQLGVPRPRIAKWETTGYTPPLWALERLSELYGLPLPRLLGAYGVVDPAD